MARSAGRRGSAVDWGAVGDVPLPPDLTRAGRGDVTPGGTHDGLDLDGVTAAAVDADGASFLDCRLASWSVEEWRLRRSRMNAVVVEDVRATTLDAADASWSEVVVRRGRVGALVAHGARLDEVSLEHLRLDYVNLRGATVERTQLVDCRVDELDLDSASVTGVRFVRCTVGRLVVRDCALDGVDLRGAQIAAVDGVGSLAGAVVSEEQLQQLAPALAAHLGIRIADGPSDLP